MSTPAGRLLSLLSLLQARRDWPGDELARRLEVSPRTVRRDVDRLREMGYPVQAVKGPDGGYRLAPGADLPPLLFDDDQAIAVAVALQTASTGIAGIQDAAQRALATIRQVMPSRLRHRVDALQITRVDGTVSVPDVDGDALVAIGTACREHRELRFGYVDKNGADTRRTVEPHRLVTWRGRWYVVAWDRDRDAWRTFRVDRMSLSSPAGARFTLRPLTDDEARDLLTPHIGPLEWPVYGRVRMALPAHEVARWLWNIGGTATAVDESSCIVEVGSWSYGSMVAWLLLFEADFEIVSPPHLRHALDELGERVARMGAARRSPDRTPAPRPT